MPNNNMFLRLLASGSLRQDISVVQDTGPMLIFDVAVLENLYCVSELWTDIQNSHHLPDNTDTISLCLTHSEVRSYLVYKRC